MTKSLLNRHSKQQHVFKLLLQLLLLMLSTYSLPASAAMISTEIRALGGQSYAYVYVLENTDIATPIQELTLYYDFQFFTDLNLADAPASWSPFVSQPDPGFNDDGIVDLLFDAGLALGEMQEPFTVEFTWLGTGAPSGIQTFELYDDSFNLLQTGITSPVPAPAPAPAPAPLLLGLALLVLFRRRPQ